MKMFKKLMSAALAGLLALSLLTGCSSGSKAVPGSKELPLPEDEEVRAVYLDLLDACEMLQEPLVYSEDASKVAEEFLEGSGTMVTAAQFAKLQETLNVTGPMSAGDVKAYKGDVKPIKTSTDSRGAYTKLKSALSSYRCNTVGIAVKELNGKKQMAIIFLRVNNPE